jgi:hypothetical protein
MSGGWLECSDNILYPDTSLKYTPPANHPEYNYMYVTYGSDFGFSPTPVAAQVAPGYTQGYGYGGVTGAPTTTKAISVGAPQPPYVAPVVQPVANVPATISVIRPDTAFYSTLSTPVVIKSSDLTSPQQTVDWGNTLFNQARSLMYPLAQTTEDQIHGNQIAIEYNAQGVPIFHIGSIVSDAIDTAKGITKGITDTYNYYSGKTSSTVYNAVDTNAVLAGATIEKNKAAIGGTIQTNQSDINKLIGLGAGTLVMDSGGNYVSAPTQPANMKSTPAYGGQTPSYYTDAYGNKQPVSSFNTLQAYNNPDIKGWTPQYLQSTISDTASMDDLFNQLIYDATWNNPASSDIYTDFSKITLDTLENLNTIINNPSQYTDTTMRNNVNAVTNTLTNLNTLINQATNAPCVNCGETVNGTINTGNSLLDSLLGPVYSLLSGVLTSISGYLSNLGGNVQVLATSARGMVTTIATALTNLPTIVTDAISAGYDKIKGVVDNIPTYINNAYNWATSQISNITGAIGDKLKEAYSWATSNAGEIAKVVIGAFNPAIAPILEAVKIASENAGQIKEWLVGEYNALSAWISQMIAAFQSTYTSISGEIGSIIEPFITPIKAAIDAIRPLTEALDYYVTHPEILKAKAAQAIGAINEAMGEVVQDFCTDPLSPTVQSPRIGV